MTEHDESWSVSYQASQKLINLAQISGNFKFCEFEFSGAAVAQKACGLSRAAKSA